MSLLRGTFSWCTLGFVAAHLIGCGAITSDSGGSDTAADNDSGDEARIYRVFVTSTQYDGALGGLDGGDAKCLARATAAGLGGTWKAWLSDSTTDVSARVVDRSPWYTPDESSVVVASYDLLTTSGATVSITIDETLTDHSGNGEAVFTGSQATGLKTPHTCSDWTSNGDGGLAADMGRGGEAGGAGAQWVGSLANDCIEPHRLYCFEQ